MTPVYVKGNFYNFLWNFMNAPGSFFKLILFTYLWSIIQACTLCILSYWKMFQYCEKSIKKDKSVTRVSFAIFVWIFDFFFRENLTQKMGFFSPGSIYLSPATWYSLVIVTIWKLVSNLMSLSVDLYDYAWSFFRGI